MEEELTACKQRVGELEALVASLYNQIELLESRNSNLQKALCSLSEKDIVIDDLSFQRPKTTNAESLTYKHVKEETGAFREIDYGITNGKCVPQLEEVNVVPTQNRWDLDGFHDETLFGTSAMNKTKDGLLENPRRHVALKVMYVGARYHGFASESCTKTTVESELFAALAKTKLLLGERKDAKYTRCGRTDKGVSAIGQVVALRLRSAYKDSSFLPVSPNDPNDDRVVAAKASRCQESCFAAASDFKEIDYVGVLNRALPLDIRILGWCYVPDGFHARFSCLSREYKYFFINEGFDIEAMRIAARKFEGVHDFRNFCKMDATNVHNFSRKILSFEVLPCDDRLGEREVWIFRVKGTAFLWHQVRCMVAVLFMIGQQNESPSVVDELLDVQITARKPQYVMAPDVNLVLHACQFEGLSFICPPSTAGLVLTQFNSFVSEHLLAAAMLKEAYYQIPSDGGLNSWKDQAPSKNIRHVPLSCRPTEPSYEDRHAAKFHNKKLPVSL